MGAVIRAAYQKHGSHPHLTRLAPRGMLERSPRRRPTMSDQPRYNRRSRHVTEGVARSPNRSMYYAMGYRHEDFDKPMIGIANGHSTITPCNAGLQKLADAAIDAVRVAGANPQVF